MEPVKDKIIYEYCLLRYVPDIERGEFINIGLMMMCKRMRWMRTGLEICGSRLESMAGRIDRKLLEQQAAVFQRTDVPFADLPVEEKYRWMAAVKSAIIQTSPSHPGILLTASKDAKNKLEEKFEELFRRLVK